MTDGDDEQISAADEQALTDLLASLVAGAPASEVSPLEIMKLARIEQRHELDARIRRFKVVRNVLVAAAFAALVVLIVPHLGSSSSTTSASASSSSSAAAAVPVPAGGAAAAASAGAAPSAASTSAASSGALASGSASAAGSAPMASEAASGAASSGAAASGVTQGDLTRANAGESSSSSAASSAAGPAGTSAAMSSGSPTTSQAGTDCPPLPGRALWAFRSAFPAGYLGAAGSVSRSASCGLLESKFPVPTGQVTVTVTVRRAPVGTCRALCHPVPRQPGVFDVNGAGGLESPVVGAAYVYANGYEVAMTTEPYGSNPAGPTLDQLVAGARAVIKTLD